MVFCKRSKSVYCHFQCHITNSGFLAKIDDELFIFNFADNAYAPGAVENKIVYVKRNVFFKIVDCFKNISEVLRKV